MKPKLIFHIGTTKTGSTALQNFLFTNRNKLLEHGILFPKCGFRILESSKIPTSGHSNLFYTDGILHDLAKELQEYYGNTVLISTEITSLIISGHGSKYLPSLEALLSLFSKIEVIVYLRRQDLWVESQYRDAITNVWQPMTLDIVEYIKQQKTLDLNYRSFLEKTKNIINYDKIYVRPYEQSQLPKGIIHDFMNILSINNYSHWDQPLPTQSNFSYSDNIVQLARLFNNMPFKNSQYSEFMTGWLPDREKKSIKTICLINKERLSINKKFADTNKYVAVNYLHKDNSILFDESFDILNEKIPNITYEYSHNIIEKVSRSLSSVTKKIINTLNNEIQNGINKSQELNKQNQELNTKNRELYKQNQEINTKNRELYKQNQELNTKNRKKYNEYLEIKKDIADKNKEITTLKATLSKKKQQLTQTINEKRVIIRKIKALKESEAWKIGYVTVKAFKEPGKNTLLWIPRLVKIFFTRIGKHPVQTSFVSSASTSSKHTEKKINPVKKKQRTKSPEQIKKELSIAGLHTVSQQSELRVFAILDDFSRLCFKPECNVIQPRPDNWQALAEYWHPDILFVESAWQGNEGSWQYRVGKYDAPPGWELQEMITWFKSQGVPTVFWNKEDPVHYDKFINAAKQFDIICTTDANRIPVYKKETTAERVVTLSFAAQPQLHNPISIGQPRKPKVCFAGSFYANRFSERQKEMEWLLDAAQKVGLDIYDRNFGMIGSEAEHFRFPERLQKDIVGKLPYDALCRAYKEYKVFLNVNSVVDSPTMFSRRIYELLASGTPIVSTYSQGIDNVFGTDLVWMVESEKEAENALETLLNDEHVWQNRSIKGIRKVFSSHTYAHRLQEIVAQAGLHLAQRVNKKNQHVFLAAEVADQSEADKLVKVLSRQTVQNYTCLLFTDDKAVTVSDNRSIELVQIDRKRQYLKDRLFASDAHYFGTLSPTSLYGQYYLEDLLNGFKYASTAITGKSATGKQFVYDSDIASHGFIVQCSELFEIGGLEREYLTLDPRKMSQLGLRCFCIDIMNYKQDVTNISDNESLQMAYDKIEL